MNKKTVRDIEVSGKRVLVRVDFNVPLDETTGNVTDDTRIGAALPTIKYLVNQGAKVILCSHLGRPKGQIVEKLRLAGVAQRLEQLLGQSVRATRDCIGSEVEKTVKEMKNSEILLLENVRFHPEEEKNDASFAQALASLAEIYVNDAFSASHRAHASVVGVTRYLPAVAGFLMEKELNFLGSILTEPAHPFAALIGGAKVSDKISLLKNTVGKVDTILIGGGMAATFLKANSYAVGLSLVEPEMLDVVTGLTEEAARKGVHLLLPVDVVVAGEISAEAKGNPVAVGNISPDSRIVDIGPQTVKIFGEELQKCKTIFWNGPMGIYEIPQFAEGTNSIAKLLADIDASIVIGGGSTAEVVTKMGLVDKMTFVSTGGGASLKFLGGEALPGVEVLPDKE
ncbi:MAG: phosphoglycerate kinase [Dehalococcoidales bacterium]|nr:phosphoglycerate kinase [Dehalococcoidales bacterium]